MTVNILAVAMTNIISVAMTTASVMANLRNTKNRHGERASNKTRHGE
ncbi:MAG: hypothetical protein RLY40_569 [Pseudomonadota bacterium]|jgi:hypothetical protein